MKTLEYKTNKYERKSFSSHFYFDKVTRNIGWRKDIFKKDAWGMGQKEKGSTYKDEKNLRVIVIDCMEMTPNASRDHWYVGILGGGWTMSV